LGDSKFEEQHKFELRDEGEVGDFLGIRITKRCLTPASTTPVGSDVDGAPFIEDWEYASIVGMLMYLAANTRPYIAYAVHQAARYTHDPRASHAVAIKRILR
jgi:hypothetical protein